MSAAFFRHLAAGLVFAVVSVSTFAQEYKYEIGGMGGGAFYMGDVNKSTPLKGMNPSLGLVFRYNANFRIAFKGGLTWARVTGSTAGLKNAFPGGMQTAFSRTLVGNSSSTSFPTATSSPTSIRSALRPTCSLAWVAPWLQAKAGRSAG